MIVGASLELGCFLAGVAIGTQTGSIVKQVCMSVCVCVCEREIGVVVFYRSR